MSITGTQWFDTSNTYIKGKVMWASTSNGSAANSSNVQAVVALYKSSSSTSYTYGTETCNLAIDNAAYNESNPITLPNNNSVVILIDRTNTVNHNSDGTKSVYITTNGSCDAGFSYDFQFMITLETIPRYPNISTFTNTSVSQSSAVFSWSTDVACSSVRAYLNNSATPTTMWTGNASSGSFTYPGLIPNTAYNLKIEVQRSDSGLWKVSNNLQFTTNTYATITNTSIDMDIGSNLVLTFKDYSYSLSSLKLYAKNSSDAWVLITSVSESLNVASYTWMLSSFASAMYALCPNSNTLNIKIECGTTINSIAYVTTYLGIANVKNSNPTFSLFTLANTDTISNTLTGSNQYMLSGNGNIRATILSTNKMSVLNSATASYYEVSYTVGSKTVLLTNITYSTNDINADIGSLIDVGLYTFTIYGVDSRGNKSNAVTKSFTILPYKAPSIDAILLRMNGFEKETTLNLTSYVSRVLISTVAKNSLVTLKYQVRIVGAGNVFGSLIDVPITSNAIDSNTDFLKITCIKPDSTNKFLDLASDTSWEIKFIITDKYKSYEVIKPVAQGKPIFNILDDNHVTVGVTPDAAMFAEPSLLQVQGDVALRDAVGNYRKLGAEILALQSSVNSLSSLSALVKTLYLLQHPVGDIVFNVTGISPATTYGGTWVAWGTGRVPVGIDTGNTNFNTVEKQSGELLHVLSIAELPPHNFTMTTQSSTNAGGWTDYGVLRASSAGYTIEKATNTIGSGSGHNNVQPSVTCYMWKRTA